MSLNVIAIAGNLTRDAELRETQGGTSVLAFTVAVNNRRKQGSEWVDDPAFVPCVMFGNRAQAIAGHLAKGLKVGVSGRITQNSWQDRETGQRRSRLEVVVADVDFMAPGGQRAQAAQPAPVRANQAVQAQPAPAPRYQGRLTGADDIPF